MLTNTPNLEGYADGLAGAGLQDRSADTPVNDLEYKRGFLEGSRDRWVMRCAEAEALAPHVAQRRPDHLPDAEERN